MATNKKRVAAYLRDRVAVNFNAYKTTTKATDSEALNQILEAFFELESGQSGLSLTARVERLESIIGDAEEF